MREVTTLAEHEPGKLPAVGESAPAMQLYTSGTTGKPKAVAVSHYAMIANVIQVRLAIGRAPRYFPGDVVLGGMYHGSVNRAYTDISR